MNFLPQGYWTVGNWAVYYFNKTVVTRFFLLREMKKRNREWVRFPKALAKIYEAAGDRSHPGDLCLLFRWKKNRCRWRSTFESASTFKVTPGMVNRMGVFHDILFESHNAAEVTQLRSVLIRVMQLYSKKSQPVETFWFRISVSVLMFSIPRSIPSKFFHGFWFLTRAQHRQKPNKFSRGNSSFNRFKSYFVSDSRVKRTLYI